MNYRKIFRTITGCVVFISLVTTLMAFTIPESKAHKLKRLHEQAEQLRKKREPLKAEQQKIEEQIKPFDEQINKIKAEYQAVEGDVSFDLDKLSKAVAFAETGECSDGTALKRNNCHGIMTWDAKGVRHPAYFKSKADSFTAFKTIWARSYKKFPDIELAKRWSGNDHPQEWLSNVVAYYYNPSL